MASTDHLQTALRTLKVLRMLSEAGRELPMSEIAERVGLGSTITFRIVRTLEAAGYVVRGADKAYRAVGSAGAPPLPAALELLRHIADAGAAGLPTLRLQEGSALTAPQLDEALDALSAARLIELGPSGAWAVSPGLLGYARSLLAGDPVLNALRPVMRALSVQTGETVTWFRRSGEEQVVVETIASPHPISYMLATGTRYPLHRGAGGLACLAGLEPADLEAYLQRYADEPSAGDAAALRGRVLRVKAVGYAVSEGERVANAVAGAVPVLGPDGRMAGVLGVMAPAFRMNADEAHAAGARLVALTADLFGRAAPSDAALAEAAE